MICLHDFVSEELRSKYGWILPGLLPSIGVKHLTVHMHAFSITGALLA